MPALPGNCHLQEVSIGGPLMPKKELCVYDAHHWKYAVNSVFTQTGTNEWEGYSTNQLVVGFPNEQAMYAVEGISLEYRITFTHSNHLIFDSALEEGGERTVSIIKNLPSKLQKTAAGYRLKNGAIEPLLPDEHGNATKIKAVGVSDNGEWLSVLVEPAGLISINLQNFEKRWFSKYKIDYTRPYVGGGPFLLVGNDGKIVARSGPGIPPVISSLLDSCGKQIDAFQTNWLANPHSIDITACPERDVTDEISDGIGAPLIYGYLVKMNNDDSEIMGFGLRYVYDEDGRPIAITDKWFNLHSSGYNFPSKLDYLALGDSFSSGEGDTEKDENGNKYYRPWTDNEEIKSAGMPREKCHISTRSYPYKLALGMSLRNENPKKWDSIACSGSKIVDVIPEDRQSDRGQDNRLAGFENYAALKAQALNEMIPGRVKQIEFVKKYRPKVITLTMGGNDIGFGDKLANCATFPTTCDSVNTRREDLASGINNIYDDLRLLYEQLYAASDYKAKIYVIGYPQFIDGDAAATCKHNVAGLNPSEREMITNSVTYLNNVIENASKAAGVKYVNIEDSLNGHKLCNRGEKYITGAADPLNLSNNRQESFHPNAKGHFEMAMSVWDRVDHKSLLEYDICPNVDENACPDFSAKKSSIKIPAYFQTSKTDKNIHYRKMTIFDQVVGKAMDVGLGIYSLAANSVVTIIGYSDPINLGQYAVGEDGSLNAKVDIPSMMRVGYHTIAVKGMSYSGEPVEYEQVILVQGDNPNDRDKDGVVDSSDPCLFIPHSNYDQDQDSTDDACDLEIGIPKDPYRLRAGDSSKLYAGISEAADALYLERNVYATSQTGVTSDYDVDGDGWVVVATNQPSVGISNLQTSPPLSPYARFWLQDITMNGSTVKQPRIAFRTKENGCVRYKPTDLSKVTQASGDNYRGFTQEGIDTNTCRIEQPEADVDNNGQQDNIQPLYRARNGNPAVSHTRADGTTFFESPTKVYLERSTRAAEAQLGKSDFAANRQVSAASINPTDNRDYRQDWSLLATTDNPPYIPVGIYRKLIIANNQLFVLTAPSLASLQCSAYKPQTLDTIKQATQTVRGLQLDFMQTLKIQMGGC